MTVLLAPAGEAAGYVAPATCAPCHAAIWRTYLQTGMGRSFSKAQAVPKLESYSHVRSDRYYSVIERGGRWFMRRYQRGYRGEVANEIERAIDYVVGSGNHARTFLSRTESGALVELPLTWYSGNGGYWAMSPGYDTPAHQDFRRRVSENCLFCHNAYPAVSVGPLPEGIDCQRCHGPGAAHVQAASTGAARDKILAGIVNPARLDTARRLEVCLQCHLETTSRPLPNMLRRYDRAPFSYLPGEPLANYALHFDHAARTGHDDKFEVNSAGYRLMKSRCFNESRGDLTCTTCHNPHDVKRGPAAEAHYSDACRQCHSKALSTAVAAKRHPAATECTSCHMPKRRAEDAVELIMTDHRIQRSPTGGRFLARLDTVETARKARYTGPVELSYPHNEASRVTNRLYLAIAQVKDLTNLKAGIRMLEGLLLEMAHAPADFFLDLAEAYRLEGRLREAIAHYEEASRRNTRLARAHGQLGETLLRLGRVNEAATALEQGLRSIRDPEILLPLGVVYAQLARIDDSIRTLTEAARLNPDHPGIWLNLAVSLEHRGDVKEAENSYRTALRVQPDFSAAHERLANLLDSVGDGAQAAYHRERARREADKSPKIR